MESIDKQLDKLLNESVESGMSFYEMGARDCIAHVKKASGGMVDVSGSYYKSYAEIKEGMKVEFKQMLFDRHMKAVQDRQRDKARLKAFTDKMGNKTPVNRGGGGRKGRKEYDTTVPLKESLDGGHPDNPPEGVSYAGGKGGGIETVQEHLSKKKEKEIMSGKEARDHHKKLLSKDPPLPEF